MNDPDNQEPLIFSTGTRVVAQIDVRALDGTAVHLKGSVGTIVKSPGDHIHAYRVRFVDGIEAMLKRHELASLKEFQSPSSHSSVTGNIDYSNNVIFCCVIGSRAYGLEHDGSDVDRRGMYLPPASAHWSLFGVPEQLENDATQECYWELGKFVSLALKANPNVLECLYSPIVEHVSGIAVDILNARSAFLSKLVYQTYNGYVMSQFKKISQDIRNQGDIKWKHVMHLIRLLHSGIGTLRDGAVPVRVDASQRDLLIDIRNGRMSWERADQLRLSLHQEFENSFTSTSLPDRPDYMRINALVLQARRSAMDI